MARSVPPGPDDELTTSHTWLGPTCALAGVAAGMRVLSVVEGGDEVMSFAASGAQVVAYAPSLAQRALLELKIAAVVDLPVNSVRSTLGYDSFGRRVWFYHYLRGRLSPAARAWWDARESAVRQGIWLQGARERDIVSHAKRLRIGGAIGHAYRTIWARRGPGWRSAAAANWGDAALALRPLLEGTAPDPWPWLSPEGIKACRASAIRIESTLESLGADFDHVHAGEADDRLVARLQPLGGRLRRWSAGERGRRDCAAPFAPWCEELD